MKKIILSAILIFLLKNLQGQAGASLHFDGIDDQVTLTHFARPQQLTIEAWVKTTFIGTGQIVGWAGTTGNSAEYKMIGGDMYYYEWDGVNWVGVQAGSAVNDGLWHHIAVVRTSATLGNVQMYVDGMLANNGSVNLPILTNALNIGAYDYSGLQQFYEGSIDELRIWKRALCAQEIQQHYQCEISGNEMGLFRYFRFNQGTGGGTNTSTNFLIDNSVNNMNGSLQSFALSGNTSNWLSPGAVASGTFCSPFTQNASVNSATICKGSSTQLSVSGASSYSWATNTQTTSSIIVSPSVTSVYNCSVGVGAECQVFLSSTVTVLVCTGLNNESSMEKTVRVFPNPTSGQLYIDTEQGAEILLFDIYGKKVAAFIYSELNGINLSEQKPGLYSIKILANPGQSRTRIIITED